MLFMNEKATVPRDAEDRETGSRWKRLPERILPTGAAQPTAPTPGSVEQVKRPRDYYYLGQDG